MLIKTMKVTKIKMLAVASIKLTCVLTGTPLFSWSSLTCLNENLKEQPEKPHVKGFCLRCTAAEDLISVNV